MAPKPALKLESHQDYVLEGESVWITVNNVSVYVRKTDKGCVVDLFRLHEEADDPLGSTYAFNDE